MPTNASAPVVMASAGDGDVRRSAAAAAAAVAVVATLRKSFRLLIVFIGLVWCLLEDDEKASDWFDWANRNSARRA